MKTFLLPVLVVAATAQKFATQLSYNTPGCNADTSTGATQITLMGSCINNQMLTMDKATGNLTITVYTEGNCTTGKPTVVFSAPVNTCGDIALGSMKFTATSQSFDQSCTFKYPPYAVVYKGSSCGSKATIVSVQGATNDCTNVGTASVQDVCKNGTTQACVYEQPNCKGKPKCAVSAVANECDPYPGNVDGLRLQMVCPGNGVPAVCPAHSGPSNNQNKPDIGGVVAGVVIVVVIVILVIVLLLYFFVIKKQQKGSSNDDGLMDGSETTYGSA